MTSGDNRCPKGAILVYASGRVSTVVRDCDCWPCSTCGPRRARVEAAHAGAISGGNLYVAKLTGAQLKAATRAAQRQGVDRLSVKWAGGGGLLVAAEHLAARDWSWSLAPTTAADLVPAMLARRIRRVDWSEGWRPAPKPSTPAGSPDELVMRIDCGPTRIDQVLAHAGVVVNGRATLHPAAAAARIFTAAHGRRRPSEHFVTHSA